MESKSVVIGGKICVAVFEKQIACNPLIAAGALHHENGHHSRLGIDRQISAVGPVVAKHSVAEMTTQAVLDFGLSGLLFAQVVPRRAR